MTGGRTSFPRATLISLPLFFFLSLPLSFSLSLSLSLSLSFSLSLSHTQSQLCSIQSPPVCRLGTRARLHKAPPASGRHPARARSVPTHICQGLCPARRRGERPIYSASVSGSREQGGQAGHSRFFTHLQVRGETCD